jgi:hypothetical protein
MSRQQVAALARLLQHACRPAAVCRAEHASSDQPARVVPSRALLASPGCGHLHRHARGAAMDELRASVCDRNTCPLRRGCGRPRAATASRDWTARQFLLAVGGRSKPVSLVSASSGTTSISRRPSSASRSRVERPTLISCLDVRPAFPTTTEVVVTSSPTSPNADQHWAFGL